jgi:hypothetical protein
MELISYQIHQESTVIAKTIGPLESILVLRRYFWLLGCVLCPAH